MVALSSDGADEEIEEWSMKDKFGREGSTVLCLVFHHKPSIMYTKVTTT